MFKFLNKRPNIISSFRRNYNDVSEYNHYRDIRLLEKYKDDLQKNKINSLTNEDKNIINKSFMYSYKDYRNYLLEEKYCKKKE